MMLFRWKRKSKSDPGSGPHIAASKTTGFCGYNEVYLSRQPTGATTDASWSVMLNVFHPDANSDHTQNGSSHNAKRIGSENLKDRWLDSSWPRAGDTNTSGLPAKDLIYMDKTAHTTMSRTTFIALLALSNARAVMYHSGPAGFRAAFGSYTGQWNIAWPIGSRAVVTLNGWDSQLRGSDIYPTFFKRRVDKCIDMLCGVTELYDSRIAFPGRKEPGVYSLEYQRHGFAAAHGSRHLYNIMGGKAHEVDFLLPRRAESEEKPREFAEELILRLIVPSLTKGETATVCVDARIETYMMIALDRIPWSTLSWSMHRGMRDVLIAYAQPILDRHRSPFANTLRHFVTSYADVLVARGWNEDFARNRMPEMVFSTIMARGGDSGDLIRVLTDAAWCYYEDEQNRLGLPIDEKRLDKTEFWVSRGRLPGNDHDVEVDMESADTIIAMTKFIVLEWSQELDYQMYHELPMELLVG